MDILLCIEGYHLLNLFCTHVHTHFSSEPFESPLPFTRSSHQNSCSRKLHCPRQAEKISHFGGGVTVLETMTNMDNGQNLDIKFDTKCFPSYRCISDLANVPTTVLYKHRFFVHTFMDHVFHLVLFHSGPVLQSLFFITLVLAESLGLTLSTVSSILLCLLDGFLDWVQIN